MGRDLAQVTQSLPIALSTAPPKLCKVVPLQKRPLAPGFHLAPK